MAQDPDGLHILDEEQCWSLVGRARLGRIALTHRALPLVLPVTFGLIDQDLIFSVSAGLLAEAAAQSQVVCFQTDSAAREVAEAWSVSLIGRLSALVHDTAIREAQKLDLAPWSSAPPRFARLSPELTIGHAWGEHI